MEFLNASPDIIGTTKLYLNSIQNTFTTKIKESLNSKSKQTIENNDKSNFLKILKIFNNHLFKILNTQILFDNKLIEVFSNETIYNNNNNNNNINNFNNNNINKQDKPKMLTKSFFDRLNYKRKETARINHQKEHKVEECNEIKKFAEEINKLIDKKNIVEKVNLCKEEYEKQHKYANSIEARAKIGREVEEKDYFLPQKIKINDMIGDFYTYKLQKKVNEKEKFYTDKMNYERESYFMKIKDGKKSTLREFDQNMAKNSIYLDIKDEGTINRLLNQVT